MKKLWLIALSAMCAATVVFAAGCGKEDDKGGADALTLQTVAAAYGSVFDATKIEESTEIKQGKLVQYTEEKAFVLSEGSYTVTGSSKRLNPLEGEASEAYTETPIAYTVQKADAFTATLDLNEAYFETVTTENSSLTAAVKTGKEKDFLKQQSLSDVSSMKVTFTMNGETLGSIVITYVSGLSDVTVSVGFTY